MPSKSVLVTAKYNSESITYARRKKRTEKIPDDIPRERIIHDIADEDKFCDSCKHPLHQIGEDTNETIEFIPVQIKVIVNVRPKYACKACEQQGTKNQIKQAPVPPSVIPKGYATPSLISQIITSKYQYGIELCRQTMSKWMIKRGKLFEILYDRMKQILLEQPVIFSDDTTVKVVGDNKSKSYMWLYGCGAASPDGKIADSDIPNIVLFDYNSDRGGQVIVAKSIGPLTLLKSCIAWKPLSKIKTSRSVIVFGKNKVFPCLKNSKRGSFNPRAKC